MPEPSWMRTHGHTSVRRRRPLATYVLACGSAALIAGSVLQQPAALAESAAHQAAEQDYGPNTCLVGYVWREAVAGDVVCVTPEVRSQTRQDNALAGSRRSSSGGPFGPDTCLQGYVWREAVRDDRVCVTPTTRDQARRDNVSADSRRNDVRIGVATYGGGRQYSVRADRVNRGPGYVGLYRSTTRAIVRSWRPTVPAHPSVPGGYLAVKTGVPVCSGAANAYFRVRDGVSTRWSKRVYVCTTL